ncbi:MAG: PP2C family protein-serine/threonine phosphatase [bacterium]
MAIIDNDNNFKMAAYKGITEKNIQKFPHINLENYRDSRELKIFQTELKLPICQEITSSQGIRGLIFLGERLTKSQYQSEDIDFLSTLVNIAATAIENTFFIEKMKSVNRDLDAKVNQLSSLFDLSKEFSGILDTERIAKLLVFSIIGQLMVSKFAVITCEAGSIKILDSRIQEDKLKSAIANCDPMKITGTTVKEELVKKFKELVDIGIELIVPMKIKGETKGLILLGKRITQQSYSQSDIEYVSSLGGIAIISIENGRLFQETIEKQRLEKDLEIARNIQQNLLPNTVPPMSNFDISAFTKSARQVGGDYYDLVKLDIDKLLFAVGDVSGKGVQAALLMANLQAFLKSICKQNIGLQQASNLINDLVSENTTMGSFITFFWGILNDSTLELTYVNMGHNPPLLIRNGEIIKLRKGGMILGVMTTVIPYESETIQLMKDDKIVIFTDGISEAMNIRNEEYSDEKLEELAIKIAPLSSKETLNNILDDVKIFTQGAEQSDDITCLVIKVR